MIKLSDILFKRRKEILSEVDNIMEDSYKEVIEDIINRVYPQIVKNLGKSKYVKTPKVELHKDIYARLSGIEDMEGEESHTSKAEYDVKSNKIFIYYPNMISEEDVIRALLHEYTHALQDPKKVKKHRERGYENDPYEIEAKKAEWGWEKYRRKYNEK